MQTFPRRGQPGELSASAGVRFGGDGPRATYVRRGFKVSMANGWSEERGFPGTSIFDDITASFVLNAEDKNVIFTFLDGLEYGEWFTLEHPGLGTGTVKVKSQTVPVAMPVLGEHGVVFTFDLVFTGMP